MCGACTCVVRRYLRSPLTSDVLAAESSRQSAVAVRAREREIAALQAPVRPRLHGDRVVTGTGAPWMAAAANRSVVLV